MSTTKIQKSTCKSPNSFPVLWLVYDKRIESKGKVQCLVRARLWFEALMKGAADMGIDQQYIDAKTWPSVIGHQTSARMAIGSRQSAISSRQSAVGNQQSAVGNQQSSVGSRQSVRVPARFSKARPVLLGIL